MDDCSNLPIDEEVWAKRDESFIDSPIPIDFLLLIFAVIPYTAYRE
jgi:hypothetical protein